MIRHCVYATRGTREICQRNRTQAGRIRMSVEATSFHEYALLLIEFCII
jgi:hypothetical protein